MVMSFDTSDISMQHFHGHPQVQNVAFGGTKMAHVYFTWRLLDCSKSLTNNQVTIPDVGDCMSPAPGRTK